jgi:hypothetical protein
MRKGGFRVSKGTDAGPGKEPIDTHGDAGGKKDHTRKIAM